MKLLFASHNRNKAVEIATQLGDKIDIATLDDLGVTDEIDETAATFEGNALIKARYLFNRFRQACFADDSGLEVEALNGAPGVRSARYAGEPSNAENNMNKLLSELEGAENRRAQFRTVLAYIDADGRETLFEGVVKGRILTEKIGTEGFGYDPIFAPEDADNQSFAQMSLSEKNLISHRGRAIAQFVEFLRKNKS